MSLLSSIDDYYFIAALNKLFAPKMSTRSGVSTLLGNLQSPISAFLESALAPEIGFMSLVTLASDSREPINQLMSDSTHSSL
jgi:hypothetical protein